MSAPPTQRGSARAEEEEDPKEKVERQYVELTEMKASDLEARAETLDESMLAELLQILLENHGQSNLTYTTSPSQMAMILSKALRPKLDGWWEGIGKKAQMIPDNLNFKMGIDNVVSQLEAIDLANSAAKVRLEMDTVAAEYAEKKIGDVAKRVADLSNVFAQQGLANPGDDVMPVIATGGKECTQAFESALSIMYDIATHSDSSPEMKRDIAVAYERASQNALFFDEDAADGCLMRREPDSAYKAVCLLADDADQECQKAALRAIVNMSCHEAMAEYLIMTWQSDEDKADSPSGLDCLVNAHEDDPELACAGVRYLSRSITTLHTTTNRYITPADGKNCLSILLESIKETNVAGPDNEKAARARRHALAACRNLALQPDLCIKITQTILPELKRIVVGERDDGMAEAPRDAAAEAAAQLAGDVVENASPTLPDRSWKAKDGAAIQHIAACLRNMVSGDGGNKIANAQYNKNNVMLDKELVVVLMALCWSADENTRRQGMLGLVQLSTDTLKGEDKTDGVLLPAQFCNARITEYASVQGLLDLMLHYMHVKEDLVCLCFWTRLVRRLTVQPLVQTMFVHASDIRLLYTLRNTEDAETLGNFETIAENLSLDDLPMTFVHKASPEAFRNMAEVSGMKKKKAPASPAKD